MSTDLFERLKTTLENNLPDARLGKPEALAAIAEAHPLAMHLYGYRALTYAWTCLACEAAHATEKHQEERLTYEVDFSVEDLGEGNAKIPEIRTRLQANEAPGKWTGTLVPNDADFVRDWLMDNASRREGNKPEQPGLDWARELLFQHLHMRRDFVKCLAMVNALLAGHTTDWQLAALGCGPLEDMIKVFGAEAVDEFVPRLKTEPALAKAIACVWISDITDPDGIIRARWKRRIAEAETPVAFDTSDTMYLPGPHMPL